MSLLVRCMVAGAQPDTIAGSPVVVYAATVAVVVWGDHA